MTNMQPIKIWKQNQKWIAVSEEFDAKAEETSPEQAIDRLISMHHDLDNVPVEYIRRKYRIAKKVTAPEKKAIDVEITTPLKEKIIIDTVPPRDGKPIVDITGMKHNRFSMIGAVLKTLKEAGWTDENLKDVRTKMTTEGVDVPQLVGVANQFVEIKENGLPFQMESGLIAQ
jgi:hypothetical protein